MTPSTYYFGGYIGDETFQQFAVDTNTKKNISVSVSSLLGGCYQMGEPLTETTPCMSQ